MVNRFSLIFIRRAQMLGSNEGKNGNQGGFFMTTNELIMAVVNAGSKVHKTFGMGLPHSIYEECIVYELSKHRIKAERQKQISLKYENLEFPNAFAIDIFVENKLLVGLKPVDINSEAYGLFIEGQIKHCNSSVGLVLDFNVSGFRSGVKIIEKSSFIPITHPLVYTEYQYGNKRTKK